MLDVPKEETKEPMKTFNYSHLKSTNYFQVNVSFSQEDVIEPDYPQPLILAPKQKGMKGMVYMAIAAVNFSLMAFFMKMLFLNSEITAYEVTYWQNLMTIFFNYIWIRMIDRDPFQVPQGLRYTLILRSFTGFLGITGYYLALQYTDLSKASILYWTNPMFTAVISACFLKELISFVDWIAVLVSFAGIIVIQNPIARQAIADLYSKD